MTSSNAKNRVAVADYVVDRRIYVGSMADVCFGRERQTGNPVVIKRYFATDQRHVVAASHDIHCSLEHEFVVKLLGVVEPSQAQATRTTRPRTRSSSAPRVHRDPQQAAGTCNWSPAGQAAESLIMNRCERPFKGSDHLSYRNDGTLGPRQHIPVVTTQTAPEELLATLSPIRPNHELEAHDGLTAIFEYMAGGDLFDRAITKKKFSEPEGRRILRMIIAGVAYLHKQDIVHRDLKPENCLLTSTDDSAIVKITDFDLAVRDHSNNIQDPAPLGSLDYMAPEVLLGKKYGRACDMWSIGCIAYVLLGGLLPFDALSKDEKKALICDRKFKFHYEYFSSLSWQAADFINRLLAWDPTYRLTAAEALCHPWMTATNIEEPLLYYYSRVTSLLHRPIQSIPQHHGFVLSQSESRERPIAKPRISVVTREQWDLPISLQAPANNRTMNHMTSHWQRDNQQTANPACLTGRPSAEAFPVTVRAPYNLHFRPQYNSQVQGRYYNIQPLLSFSRPPMPLLYSSLSLGLPPPLQQQRSVPVMVPFASRSLDSHHDDCRSQLSLPRAPNHCLLITSPIVIQLEDNNSGGRDPVSPRSSNLKRDREHYDCISYDSLSGSTNDTVAGTCDARCLPPSNRHRSIAEVERSPPTPTGDLPVSRVENRYRSYSDCHRYQPSSQNGHRSQGRGDHRVIEATSNGPGVAAVQISQQNRSRRHQNRQSKQNHHIRDQRPSRRGGDRRTCPREPPSSLSSSSVSPTSR